MTIKLCGVIVKPGPVLLPLILLSSANLEELQIAEARQASNIESQLEDLKGKCQEKQNKVEEARCNLYCS